MSASVLRGPWMYTPEAADYHGPVVMPPWLPVDQDGPHAPPPNDHDYRGGPTHTWGEPIDEPAADPLRDFAESINDGGADLRRFLGTDGGSASKSPGDSEAASEPDDGGPFGLTALADLPDIVLRPEDRLWWDAVLVGHVTLLSGPPGVGKTTLLRRIIHAISKGEEFLGWRGPACGARVAVLDYETPGIDRKARWTATYGDETGEVYDVLVSTKTAFLNEIDLDLFLAELRRREIKLLVVDTMARAFTVKSENDNAEMTEVVGLLKRIADAGLAVVVIGHFGKTNTRGLRALRGASSIVAAVDVVVGFYRETEPSEKKRGGGKSRAGADEEDDEGESDEDVQYVLEILKNRTAPESSLRVYRCGDGDFRIAPGSESAEKRAKSLRLVETLVRDAGLDGMSTEQVQKAGRDQGLSKRTVAGALSTLREQKRLHQLKRGHYVHVDFEAEETGA